MRGEKKKWLYFCHSSRLSHQGKIEGLRESGCCHVLSQQLCQFIKWELWINNNNNEYNRQSDSTCLETRKAAYLGGYSVGAWCGTGDVVETIGDGSILHDVTGVDDVWTGGRDLNLNLIADTGTSGAEAHPGEQLSNSLSGLTVGRKPRTLYQKAYRKLV